MIAVLVFLYYVRKWRADVSTISSQELFVVEKRNNL